MFMLQLSGKSRYYDTQAVVDLLYFLKPGYEQVAVSCLFS